MYQFNGVLVILSIVFGLCLSFPRILELRAAREGWCVCNILGTLFSQAGCGRLTFSCQKKSTCVTG